MQKTVLIIDDEKDQAQGIQKVLSKELPHINFEAYSEESAILEAIEHRFYSLAFVDIRMDKYEIDGLDIVNKIFEVNPFSKVIIISAFKDEYFNSLKNVLLSGKVVDVLDKKLLSEWIPELKKIVVDYYDSIDQDPSEINKALLQYYADAKNEDNSYRKGEKFEHFVSLLFQSFGYSQVLKRVKDKSLNETDLVIRNEIEDNFLNKFGKYLLVECKNKPEDKVGKNDFIQFYTKLQNTNGLAELGILATTGYISRNTYLEAIRTSHENQKVLFVSNPEFEILINSTNKKEDFKKIIDSQVKDN